MKYLEDSRLTQLTSDLSGAYLNTLGSGGGGGSSPVGGIGRNGRGNKNRGKGKNKQTAGKNEKGLSPSYYTYNPAGYSTYNESGSSSSSGSSSRAIYGRVEAYTTKRAGSDKKTAFEVGERYAAEMERLNEAVEALKRRKKHGGIEDIREDNIDLEKNDSSGEKVERRLRSQSVDGVTFAATSPRFVYDLTANSSNLMSLEEGAVAEGHEALQDTGEENTALQANKRHLPLEGILKLPPSSLSSNKRFRAASFDVSTGPSTFSGAASSHLYRHSESSRSLLAETTWASTDTRENNNTLPLSIVHPTIEEERKARPLIPQPSLYRSSIGSEHIAEPDAGGRGGPATVPRRLVTDLILTLNASFPDYDFGDAQVSDFCKLSSPEAMRRINERLGEFVATTDAGRDFLPRLWGSVEDVLFGDLRDCEAYSYAPREGRGTGDDDPLEFLTRSMADSDYRENFIDGADVRKGTGGLSFDRTGRGRIVSDDLDASAALNFPNQVSPSTHGDFPPHVTLWSMNYFFVSRNKKRIVLFACVQTVRTPRGDYDDYDLGGGDSCGENNLVFDEARREKRGGGCDEASYTSLTRMSNTVLGSVSDGGDCKMLELYARTTGDESVGVMVEGTDFEEGVDVEVDDADDGDEVHVHNDFDTGALSAPSQAA